MKNKKVIGIFSLLLAIMFITMGIVIIPNFSALGTFVLQYIIAGLVLCYAFLYLLPRAVKYSGINQILSIIEMVLDIVIAVTLILNFKLNFLLFNDLFYVIMLIIWLHALFSLLGGYYLNKYTHFNYPIYLLLIDVFLIVLSTLGMINPILKNNALIIMVTCVCISLGIIALVYGLVYLFKKEKKS